jgi:short-subunit dehydrogenase
VISGRLVKRLPQGAVMRVKNIVNAALTALDQGEAVTIPSLPTAADWHAFETARQKLVPNLSHADVAGRHLKTHTIA